VPSVDQAGGFNQLSGMEEDSLLPVYPQGPFNAEFLDAAGGLMIQNLFDSGGGWDERVQDIGGSIPG
jgi:transcriptional regulatory protein GAL4